MENNPIYEIKSDVYNKLLAEALKKIPEVKEPEWAVFVKTGVAKKRPPQEIDFWHKRAASILRQIYIHKTVGVNRLRTRYGSKKNRGYKPERFRKASGKIIRTILQQTEAAGLLEKYKESGKRCGRRLTEKGKAFLENIKNKPISHKILSEQKSNLNSKLDIENKINEKIEKVEKNLEKENVEVMK